MKDPCVCRVLDPNGEVDVVLSTANWKTLTVAGILENEIPWAMGEGGGRKIRALMNENCEFVLPDATLDSVSPSSREGMVPMVTFIGLSEPVLEHWDIDRNPHIIAEERTLLSRALARLKEVVHFGFSPRNEETFLAATVAGCMSGCLYFRESTPSRVPSCAQVLRDNAVILSLTVSSNVSPELCSLLVAPGTDLQQVVVDELSTALELMKGVSEIQDRDPKAFCRFYSLVIRSDHEVKPRVLAALVCLVAVIRLGKSPTTTPRTPAHWGEKPIEGIDESSLLDTPPGGGGRESGMNSSIGSGRRGDITEPAVFEIILSQCKLQCDTEEIDAYLAAHQMHHAKVAVKHDLQVPFPRLQPPTFIELCMKEGDIPPGHVGFGCGFHQIVLCNASKAMEHSLLVRNLLESCLDKDEEEDQKRQYGDGERRAGTPPDCLESPLTEEAQLRRITTPAAVPSRRHTTLCCQCPDHCIPFQLDRPVSVHAVQWAVHYIEHCATDEDTKKAMETAFPGRSYLSLTPSRDAQRFLLVIRQSVGDHTARWSLLCELLEVARYLDVPSLKHAVLYDLTRHLRTYGSNNVDAQQSR